MPRFAIRVTSAAGEGMFVREGAVIGAGLVVTFRSRAQAQRTLEVMLPGIEDGEIATIIPFSRVPAEERD